MLFVSDAHAFKHLSDDRLRAGGAFVEPMRRDDHMSFTSAVAEIYSRARDDSLAFRYGIPVYPPYPKGSVRFGIWNAATCRASEWDETPYPPISGRIGHRKPHF